MILEELLNISLTDIVADTRLSGFLVKYYRQIFDNNACFCGSKYEQYYNRLKNEGLETMKNQQDCDFKLKTNGALPMIFGSAESISNISMTNEKALRFLKANKNRIRLFVEFPKNWERLLETSTEEITGVPETEIAALENQESEKVEVAPKPKKPKVKRYRK